MCTFLRVWTVTLILVTGGCAFVEPVPAGPNKLDQSSENKKAASASYLMTVNSALALADTDDEARAVTKLTKVISDPMFHELPAQKRYATLSLAGSMALRNQQFEHALGFLLMATELNAGNAIDWFQLSLVEVALGNGDQAAEYFSKLAREWPEVANQVSDEVFHLVKAGTEDNSTARFELLQSLFDARWHPNRAIASNLWYELALMQMARNDLDSVAEIVPNISTPSDLVKLASDNRFNSISVVKNLDIDTAASNHLAALRVLSDESPNNLEITLELFDALLTAGRHQEVLDISDAWIARLALPTSDAPPIQGIQFQVWVANKRVTALRRLNRTEEAVAQLIAASKDQENGHRNVSQILNLGDLYVSLGQPDDAIAAVKEVGEMSGYGQMVLKSVTHAAFRQKGDLDNAESALSYIRQYKKDAPIILVEALVEANKMDEAAKYLIEMLNSPDDRGVALLWLQIFRERPSLPGTIQWDARCKVLRSREDVIDAVKTVGQIKTYEIFG